MVAIPVESEEALSVCSLDPSTTAIGYALRNDDGELSFRLITPHPDSSHWFKRLIEMEFLLRRQIQQDKPEHFIIEEPDSDTQFRRGSKGKKFIRSGQATYGTSVGWVTHLCSQYVRHWGRNPFTSFTFVKPSQWTVKYRRRKRDANTLDLFGGSDDVKAPRRMRAKAICSDYKPNQDPGGDIADAICLLDFWEMNEKLKGARR